MCALWQRCFFDAFLSMTFLLYVFSELSSLSITCRLTLLQAFVQAFESEHGYVFSAGWDSSGKQRWCANEQLLLYGNSIGTRYLKFSNTSQQPPNVHLFGSLGISSYASWVAITQPYWFNTQKLLNALQCFQSAITFKCIELPMKC